MSIPPPRTTRALHKLRADGVQIDPDAVAALSPYVRSHISRFGQYTLDLSPVPPPVDYELSVLSAADATDQPMMAAAAGD